MLSDLKSQFISYGRQQISNADIEAVVEVLQSDFLTQGPKTPLFEKSVADYCGVEYAVAVNSATSALHIACLALGLGKGDWLWTSPNTFVASANCALYCGAKVDFVDIDPETYNLSIEALTQKLKEAEHAGKLPKIVVPVHFAGQPCDMESIYQLSQQYGFHVIEDASHAIGARYQDLPVGNCLYSDITVFSFHPVKIITTAEGGVATTNQPSLAEKMALLQSHGITRDESKMTHAPDGGWYYQQIALGFNYRMTELQAALGVSQMARLDEFVSRRHELAQIYQDTLAGLPLKLPYQAEGRHSSLHLYPVQVGIGFSRRDVFDKMRAASIGVNVHYIPVHLQPYYQQMGFKLGDFPQAENYYQHAVSLPLHPGMDEADQARVIQVLTEVLQ